MITKKRRSQSLALLSLCVFALCAGCKQEALVLPPFDGARAFEEVAALVEISPRDAGTPAARQAAEHLFQRLEALGIAAEIATFGDQTPEGIKTFHNVIGRIPGTSEQWLILGSHFDTMPGIAHFQGANDSGSSTGVLLELARILSGQSPNVGIIFAFFDGEEGIADYCEGDGLHGSRHMARQLLKSGTVKKIDCMILLDMVGDPDLNFTLPYNTSSALAKDLFDVARELGQRNRLSLSKSNIIDDHVPFLEIGIPALDLIDFKFGSAPGLNDFWHTEMDTMEHISAQSLQITGDLVRGLLIKRNGGRANQNP